MSDQSNTINDPTNRIVAVLEKESSADAARRDIADYGIAGDSIRTFQGGSDAEGVDTSAKWFADTDDEMEHFQQQLRSGNIVISIPVSDEKCRDAVHKILKRHNAFRITHFGKWVTEVMR